MGLYLTNGFIPVSFWLDGLALAPKGQGPEKDYLEIRISRPTPNKKGDDSMNTYFGEVPGIGKLEIEQVFYHMDEPVLFTALDKNKNRYLCACTELGIHYLIAKVTNKTLIRLMANGITIREAFLKHDAICIEWDGKSSLIKTLATNL